MKKNSIPKIGVIGKGFVGAATANGFSAGTGFNSEIRIFDKDGSKGTHTLEDLIDHSEIVFICVPTPAHIDGSIDVSIIESVFNEINDIKSDNKLSIVFVIKSTIVPGTSRKIQEKYNKMKIVFNPEFLTERSSNFDFINQARIVLGGEESNTKKIRNLYEDRFGLSTLIIETNFETAELIKYACNNYFSLKISFLNELKLLANKVNVDWEVLINGFVSDGRIGHSHLNVPGHDGLLGFGGACFPKDIQAMIKFAQSHGIEMRTLEAAWETNLNVRPEKDWEKLLGRAVSHKSDGG